MKKIALILALVLALLLPGLAQATAVNFGATGKAYKLGARNLVRNSAGNLYACVLNATAGQIEMWEYSGGSWSLVGGASGSSGNAYLTAYGSADNCAGAIDSNGYIDVVYYSSSTALSYVQFNSATNTWGTPATIVTITSGGSYYCCAIANDSNNYSHIAFNNYYGSAHSQIYYINNTAGGVWHSVVGPLNTFTDCCYPDIAMDTTNGSGHRYNIPQIAYLQNNGTFYMQLGNANNGTSFTSAYFFLGSTPSIPSIIIDSNGQTTGFISQTGDSRIRAWYIPGSGTWSSGFTGPEAVEVGTTANWLAAAVNGTTRYCFMFYQTPSLYQVSSTAYGTWGTPTQIPGDSPSSAGAISVLWSYGVGYATYGIDYLFTSGTGGGNLYYDNILKPAPSHHGTMIPWFRR